LPIIEGWEIPPDRIKTYEKMMEIDDIGDPIITSKCQSGGENGVLIASTNGYAWRIKLSTGRIALGALYGGALGAGAAIAGNYTWVRWHEIADIIPLKKAGVKVKLKRYNKNGELLLDKKGNIKTRNNRLWIMKNNGESRAHIKQRVQDFPNIMIDLWNRYKGE